MLASASAKITESVRALPFQPACCSVKQPMVRTARPAESENIPAIPRHRDSAGFWDTSHWFFVPFKDTHVLLYTVRTAVLPASQKGSWAHVIANARRRWIRVGIGFEEVNITVSRDSALLSLYPPVHPVHLCDGRERFAPELRDSFSSEFLSVVVYVRTHRT